MTRRLSFALLLFDGVDLLDVGGPYEVFLTANRLAARNGDQAPFEVTTITIDGASVQAYGGLRLLPHGDVDSADPDVLVVPGLVEVGAALRDQRLLSVIGSVGRSCQAVTSVCTGAFLLAGAGLLDDVTATTHFEDVEALGNLIGSTNAVQARWVDAGRVVTAGGLSNGIAMALHLVDRFHSLTLAQRTARQIEYPWDPTEGITA